MVLIPEPKIEEKKPEIKEAGAPEEKKVTKQEMQEAVKKLQEYKKDGIQENEVVAAREKAEIVDKCMDQQIKDLKDQIKNENDPEKRAKLAQDLENTTRAEAANEKFLEEIRKREKEGMGKAPEAKAESAAKATPDEKKVSKEEFEEAVKKLQEYKKDGIQENEVVAAREKAEIVDKYMDQQIKDLKDQIKNENDPEKRAKLAESLEKTVRAEVANEQFLEELKKREKGGMGKDSASKGKEEEQGKGGVDDLLEKALAAILAAMGADVKANEARDKEKTAPEPEKTPAPEKGAAPPSSGDKKPDDKKPDDKKSDEKKGPTPEEMKAEAEALEKQRDEAKTRLESAIERQVRIEEGIPSGTALTDDQKKMVQERLDKEVEKARGNSLNETAANMVKAADGAAKEADSMEKLKAGAEALEKQRDDAQKRLESGIERQVRAENDMASGTPLSDDQKKEVQERVAKEVEKTKGSSLDETAANMGKAADGAEKTANAMERLNNAADKNVRAETGSKDVGAGGNVKQMQSEGKSTDDMVVEAQRLEDRAAALDKLRAETEKVASLTISDKDPKKAEKVAAAGQEAVNAASAGDKTPKDIEKMAGVESQRAAALEQYKDSVKKVAEVNPKITNKAEFVDRVMANGDLKKVEAETINQATEKNTNKANDIAARVAEAEKGVRAQDSLAKIGAIPQANADEAKANWAKALEALGKSDAMTKLAVPEKGTVAMKDVGQFSAPVVGSDVPDKQVAAGK